MNKYRKVVVESYKKKDLMKHFNKASNKSIKDDDCETKEEFFDLCLDEIKLLKDELFEQYKVEVRPFRTAIINYEKLLKNPESDTDKSKSEHELIELNEAVGQIDLDEFKTTFYLELGDDGEKNKIMHLRYSEMTEIETALHEAINEITNQVIPPQHFTKTLSDKKLNYLFSQLTEDNIFLIKDEKITDLPSFYFVFGNGIKPETFRPLFWQQNVQLLRELLKDILQDGIYKSQEFEIPPYFKKKNGQLINHLSGDKPKLNTLSDTISDIHRKMKKIH